MHAGRDHATATVAVRIQHHPARAHLLPPLLAALAPLSDVRAVADPGGPLPCSWRSHRACLEAIPDLARHLLVVQDDAVLCGDFAAKTLEVLLRWPDTLLALFVPGFPPHARSIRDARRRGHDHVALRVQAFVPTVCVVYPAAVARDLLEWFDGRRWTSRVSDDGALALYARARGLPVIAPLPSLCDHDDRLPSLMGDRRPAPHRRAAWFAG